MSITSNPRQPVRAFGSVAAAWPVELSIACLLFAATMIALGIWGIGVSWDSNYYLMFSQSMRLNFDFSTQGLYAPLYPMILAALTALGASTEFAANVVHASAVAIVFLASSRLVREAGAPPAIAWVAGLYASIVAIGSYTFQYIWTEVPYVAALTASTAIAVAFWRGSIKPSIWWFLPLGLLAPFRFIGLFPAALLGSLMAWRLWDGQRRPSWMLFVRLACAGILTAGPIAVFGVLNEIAWGCALGCRDPSSFSLGQNLALTFSTFKAESPQLAGGALVLAVAACASLWGARTPATSPRPENRGAWTTWAFPLAVVVISVAAQVYASTRAEIDPINPRYFTPLYPDLVIGLVAGAWRVLQVRPRSWGRPALVTALVGALLSAAYLDFAFYSELLQEAADHRASLAEFGFKGSPMRRQFQDAQAALLSEDNPGTLVTYFPRTEESTNIAAYLVLDLPPTDPLAATSAPSAFLPTRTAESGSTAKRREASSNSRWLRLAISHELRRTRNL